MVEVQQLKSWILVSRQRIVGTGSCFCMSRKTGAHYVKACKCGNVVELLWGEEPMVAEGKP
jgi:hypothetical protein